MYARIQDYLAVSSSAPLRVVKRGAQRAAPLGSATWLLPNPLKSSLPVDDVLESEIGSANSACLRKAIIELCKQILAVAKILPDLLVSNANEKSPKAGGGKEAREQEEEEAYL
jgi:hypothetical protein